MSDISTNEDLLDLQSCGRSNRRLPLIYFISSETGVLIPAALFFSSGMCLEACLECFFPKQCFGNVTNNAIQEYFQQFSVTRIYSFLFFNHSNSSASISSDSSTTISFSQVIMFLAVNYGRKQKDAL